MNYKLSKKMFKVKNMYLFKNLTLTDTSNIHFPIIEVIKCTCARFFMLAVKISMLLPFSKYIRYWPSMIDFQ